MVIRSWYVGFGLLAWSIRQYTTKARKSKEETYSGSWRGFGTSSFHSNLPMIVGCPSTRIYISRATVISADPQTKLRTHNIRLARIPLYKRSEIAAKSTAIQRYRRIVLSSRLRGRIQPHWRWFLKALRGDRKWALGRWGRREGFACNCLGFRRWFHDLVQGGLCPFAV